MSKSKKDGRTKPPDLRKTPIRMSLPQKNTVRFVLIGLIFLAVGSLLVQELEDEAAPLVQALPEPRKSGERSLSSPAAPTPATLTTVGGITVQVDQRTGTLLPPTLEQKRALAQSLRDRFGKPPQAVFMFFRARRTDLCASV